MLSHPWIFKVYSHVSSSSLGLSHGHTLCTTEHIFLRVCCVIQIHTDQLFYSPLSILYLPFSRAKSDQKCSIVSISGQEMPNLHFQASTEFKNVCEALSVRSCFHPPTPFPQTKRGQHLASPLLFSWQTFGRSRLFQLRLFI